MTSLEYLDLSHNTLKGLLPNSFSKLCRLQALQLQNCNLTGLFSDFLESLSCAQNSLEVLYLPENHLEGSLPHLTNFSSLRELFLHGNQLHGTVPESIGQQSNLESIYIGDNVLEGEITENHFSNLSRLTSLQLGPNSLVLALHSGWVPPFHLEILHLPSCNVGPEFPNWLQTQKNLSVLHLDDNEISGTLPNWFGNSLQNMTFLSLTHNQIGGKFPTSGFDVPEYIGIDLSRNLLEGPIPSVLRRASSLVLSSNRLSSMDSFLCSTEVTHLSYLSLYGNHFSGEISDCWKHFKKLVFLDVSNNAFTGRIPPTMGFLVSLVSLKLNANRIGGELPLSLRNCTDLSLIDIGDNKLTGAIPDWLGVAFPDLAILVLRSNHFNGAMPSQLCQMQQLQVMDFSTNNISGTIPKCLSNMTTLAQAGYTNPSITHRYFAAGGVIGGYEEEVFLIMKGTRSKYKSILGLVKSIDLSSNRLSGEIPSEITHLVGLVSLDLSRNYLRGEIPRDIGNLKSLSSLDLSRNQMDGRIPTSLFQIYSLGYLNLSYNDFSGEIPVGPQLQSYDRSSFVGNLHLCGIPLKKCSSEKNGRIPHQGHPVGKPTSSNRAGLSHKMKIVISLVAAFTLLGNAVMVYFFCLCKKKKETVEKNLGNKFSYAALLKATDGFSPSNLIGTGAFASVYKGILEDDGVVVAVKVFNMLHRGASKSFMAECEVLRNIRHRNLVKIITACSSIDYVGNDFKALVYDFMDNGSLEEWLHPSTRTEDVTEAPKVLNLVQRLNIAIDVACALDYVHNNCETPIVHCDLKPSNVLLDKEMTGHVSDFGLAKFLSIPAGDVSGTHSSSIAIRGTIGYAPPEYGMGSEVSKNGDIYSFGILLLEMFTGKRPTDHMFSDGFNLHSFVKMALPERVLEIADSLALQECSIINVAESSNQSSVRAQKVEECLTMIFGIGIACSVESPTNRKGISEAAAELRSIRDNLLN